MRGEGVFSWLRQVKGDDLVKAAEWLCDPTFVRQTETIEFTDLTNISHRMDTELGDTPVQILCRDGQRGKGLIMLGCFRRGMPVQHTKLVIRAGGNEYPLTRLKAGETDDLAINLLDTVWRRCSELEREGIPSPLEFNGDDPSMLTGRRYVDPYWESFLGMRGRNVNADWTLMRSRFRVSEKGDRLWHEPGPDEIRWSVSRALLAKLAARLAFSYIVSAWVPSEAIEAVHEQEGPSELSFEFQERILDPDEQVTRVKAVERRTKKVYEKAYREALETETEDDREAAKIAKGNLRRVPQTYLGLLDPAMDDPDDQGRTRPDREPDPPQPGGSHGQHRLLRLKRFLSRRAESAANLLHFARRRYFFIGTLAKFGSLAALVAFGTTGLLSWNPFASGAWGAVSLFLAVVLAGYFMESRWRLKRLSTVVLPTWSVGSSTPIFEVRTPKEFLVWQGIIARPSNRGRSWKTRPAVELGRKAHLWWQDPSDRGEVPPFVPGRPLFLILELRARLSRDITLYGGVLCLLAALLLLGPAVLSLTEVVPWGDLENLGADTLATVLLLLPTAGGALLVRPGEDPIAARLLQRDRLAVALGAVAPSALAAVSLVLFGWPDANPPPPELPGEPSDFMWYLWTGLGAVALTVSVALAFAFRHTRSVERSQPEARQHSESRRSPLDIPAPLPPLDRFWGRRWWYRTMVRLAPRRTLRTVKPPYSLVLPAEGSRIYTPPAPTVVCVMPKDGQDSESGTRPAAAMLEELGKFLARGQASHETNDLAWVASRSLRRVEPSEEVVGGTKEDRAERESLRYLLRLQLANSRPSDQKPFGNGGGLCILRVEDELFNKLKVQGAPRKTVKEKLLLGDELFPKETLGGEAPQARFRLARAVDRACLDFDALLLLDDRTSDGEDKGGNGGQARFLYAFDELKDLSAALSEEAAYNARRAGAGTGAHPWPSSLESPLAGESSLWRGRLTAGSWLSVRAPLLYRRIRAWRWVGRLQRLLFDHGRREIPAAVLTRSAVAGPGEGEAPEEPRGRGLLDSREWLNRKVPRAFSRRAGAVEDQFVAVEGETDGEGGEEKEIPVVLIAGNIASGKTDLALLLRSEFVKSDSSEDWATFAPGRANLFFQLLNTADEEADYLITTPNTQASPQGMIKNPVQRHLTYLMQATFIEYSCHLFDDSITRVRRSGAKGVIGEYWPEYSVEVMAKVEMKDYGVHDDYGKLQARLREWTGRKKNVKEIYVLLEERVPVLLERAARRQLERRNERLTEEALNEFATELKKFINLKSSLLQELPPSLSCGRKSQERMVVQTAHVNGGKESVVVVTDRNMSYGEGLIERLVEELKGRT